MSKTETINSIKEPAIISISGFDALDSMEHMIVWLGRGPRFREFIVGDIESELYAQDKSSQLISLELGQPEHETKLIPLNDGTSHAALAAFLLALPFTVIVRSGDSRFWRLNVRLSYVTESLNLPGKQSLRLNFNVLNAECLQPEHA